MILVLDASAGIEVALSRPEAARIKSLLSSATKVISSDLYRVEVANVLWKYVKAGLLTPQKTQSLLKLTQDLVDEYVDISVNNEEAMLEAMRLNHPVYDMLYFTLTRRTGATLISLDQKLNAICLEAGLSVVAEQSE